MPQAVAAGIKTIATSVAANVGQAATAVFGHTAISVAITELAYYGTTALLYIGADPRLAPSRPDGAPA